VHPAGAHGRCVHVIVLRGAGEKFFCAGANINMLNSVTPQFKYYFCLHANETLNRLEQTPKLVIAALNGHTVGGGLEIAMAADIRIARKGGQDRSAGGQPGRAARHGRDAAAVPDRRQVGAIELMITGRTFDFDEAARLGIVTDGARRRVGRASSWTTFMEYAARSRRRTWPPKAVGNIKRAVQTGAELPFQDALAVERELQQLLFQSQDAKEGLGGVRREAQGGQFKGR
jgi:enoyl-CoA hydratase